MTELAVLTTAYDRVRKSVFVDLFKNLSVSTLSYCYSHVRLID